MPPGTWLGSAGDAICGHELIQEEKRIREGETGSVFFIRLVRV